MPTYRPTLRDIEHLGTYGPEIFGKALDPEHLGSRIGEPIPVSGRPDYVDEASPKIWRAFQALDRLYALAAQGKQGRRHAAALMYFYAACSSEVRLTDGVYVMIAAGCRGETPPERPRRVMRKTHPEAYEVQERAWRQWRERKAALEMEGREILMEAVDAWEGLL
jgi:hypothetical protein